MLREAIIQPLSDEELFRALDLLTQDSGASLSDRELSEVLAQIHLDFPINACIFEPGLMVYRMVQVDQLPTNQDRVSYPPTHLLHQYGRANRPGESIFYGTVDSWYPCMFESRMEENSFYALSIWRSKARIMCGVVGYSAETLAVATVASRQMPIWAQMNDKSDRQRAIRAWQAKLFTQVARQGSQSQYRMSVALRDRFMLPIIDPGDNGLTEMDGIIFPSVASTCLFDNVALLPASTDEKLDLLEVHLLLRYGGDAGSSLDPQRRFTINIKSCLQAANDKGVLVWGTKPQFNIEEGLSQTSSQTKLSGEKP